MLKFYNSFIKALQKLYGSFIKALQKLYKKTGCLQEHVDIFNGTLIGCFVYFQNAIG